MGLSGGLGLSKGKEGIVCALVSLVCIPTTSDTATAQKGGAVRNAMSGKGKRDRDEPDLVTGWEYHTYDNSSTKGGDRYVYIGKDETTGEPEFIGSFLRPR
jgi:hypothetical protein